LRLIVLRANDVEQTVGFYRALGIAFSREQHGDGPIHYAGVVDGVVLELYPATMKRPTDTTMLGFAVDSLDRLPDANVLSRVPGRVVLEDPDARRVELTTKGSAPSKP
jgi:lactoylglutathione lyase